MKKFRFWTVLTSLWVIGLLYAPPIAAQTDACGECAISPGNITWVEGNACQIIANVTASSSRCPIIRFEYDWGDGSTGTYTGGGNSHYYSGNGSYTVCITEVRGNGTIECKQTYCVPVTVTNCSQGCQECGFQPGNIVLGNGQPCQVIAGVSASSSACATTGYIYNWGDGTITTSPFGLQAHTYTANGTYTVCVTEIRGSGATECRWTYCGQISVTECSTGCKSCDFKPGQISWQPGQACQIVAGISGSSSTCPVTSFITNWGDGNTTTSTGSASGHFYTANGTYTVCITEVRGSGTEECRYQYCTQVTVSNCNVIDPCTVCPITPGQISWTAGQDCQIIAGVSGSSSPCPVTSFITDWGDGNTTTSTGSASWHFYAANGTYTVCITEVRGNGTAECRQQYCTQVTVSNCNVIDPCTVCPITPGQINWTAGQDCQIIAGVSGSSSPCPVTSFITDWGDGNTTTSTGSASWHFYAANGTYTVCIIEVRGNGTEECRERYCAEVTVTNCPACAPDTHEPDNSVAQATFGGSGCNGFQWINYCLSPGDQDFVSVLGGAYYFVVRGGDAFATGLYGIRFNCTNNGQRCLEIETLPVGGSTTNTFLELYEAATNTLVASDDNSGTGDFSWLNYCIPSKMGEMEARTWQLYPSHAEAGDFIRYTLPEGMVDVELTLVDVNGRRVQTYVVQAGEGKFRLPATIAAGMYFVRPNAANLAAQKLIVK